MSELEGVFCIFNSERSLETAHKLIDDAFAKFKYGSVQINSGKRTLSQNALKSVWYLDIAKHRGDVTAKDVERECKYKYGVLILRRDKMHDYVFSKSVDKLPYAKRLKVMDCFAITSVMKVGQLKEYLNMMQTDYPFLEVR